MDFSNTENAKVMNYDVKLLEIDPDETQGCDVRSMSGAVQVVSYFKLRNMLKFIDIDFGVQCEASLRQSVITAELKCRSPLRPNVH